MTPVSVGFDARQKRRLDAAAAAAGLTLSAYIRRACWFAELVGEERWLAAFNALAPSPTDADAPYLPADWTPRPGALWRMPPARVHIVPGIELPPWEPARRLVEGDDA